MTPSCSWVVMRFSRCAVAFRPSSSRCALNCRIWLRASTSSRTRFINLSSRPPSTRMVESAMPRPLAGGMGASDAPGLGLLAGAFAAPEGREGFTVTAGSAAGGASSEAGPLHSCASAGAGGVTTLGCSRSAGWAATGSAGRGVSSSVAAAAGFSRAGRSPRSGVPSVPVASMAVRMLLAAFTLSRISDTRDGVSGRSPLRSRFRMFSTTCARNSRAVKRRKPHVPLIVSRRAPEDLAPRASALEIRP
jgi:hypothetical protein